MSDLKIANFIATKKLSRNFDRSAEHLIASTNSFCSQLQRKLIVEKIDIESRQTGEAYRQDIYVELELSKMHKAPLETQALQLSLRLDNVKQEFEQRRANPGSLIVSAFMFLCLIICLVSEFALTLNTLPYILDIRKNSFEGIMFALITVAAVASLEIVIGILIWKRWRELITRQSRTVRVSGWILIFFFLLSIAWLDIHTIATIAPAREEVVKEKRNLELPEGQKPELIDYEKIDRAIYWISISAAINGALFFLIWLEALNTAYWRTLVAVVLLRFRHRRLLKRLARVDVRLNTALANWTHIDDRVSEVVEANRTTLLILLEEAFKRPPQARTYLNCVNDILAARVRS